MNVRWASSYICVCALRCDPDLPPEDVHPRRVLMGVHGCTCGRATGGGLMRTSRHPCVRVLSACAHVLEVPGRVLEDRPAAFLSLSHRVRPCHGGSGLECWQQGRGALSAHCPPAASGWTRGGWARAPAPSCTPPPPTQRTRLPLSPKVMSNKSSLPRRGQGGPSRAGSPPRLLQAAVAPSSSTPQTKPPAAHHEAALRAARAPLVTRPARAAPGRPAPPRPGRLGAPPTASRLVSRPRPARALPVPRLGPPGILDEQSAWPGAPNMWPSGLAVRTRAPGTPGHRAKPESAFGGVVASRPDFRAGAFPFL